jgi:hypothetical protein
MAFINTLYHLWPSGDEKIPGLRDGYGGGSAGSSKNMDMISRCLVPPLDD